MDKGKSQQVDTSMEWLTCLLQFSAGSGDDADACTKAPTTLGKWQM